MTSETSPEVTHAEWPPRFQMALSVWPGTAKLAEECNELGQVIMKIIGTAGTMRFADGQTVDPERLIEEMGDVEAAIEMVKRYSLDYYQRQRVLSRRSSKIDLFESWRTLEARPPEHFTSVAPREGEMEQTVLADAMQDVWNEWCADTGCVPDGFHIHGPGTTRLTADFKISPFPDLVLAALKRSGYQLVKKKPERENRFATGAKLSGEY